MIKLIERRFEKRQYEENSFVRDFLRVFLCCLGLGRDVSLRSRRLQVICKKEHARGEGVHSREAHENLSPCVSSSHAPVLSCAHYFKRLLCRLKRCGLLKFGKSNSKG